MESSKINTLIELLKKEMVPAMGCTEPAASALSGAKARELLGQDVEKATVYASRDMVKNAMGVGLPNCDLKGILAAVSLGICGGDTKKSLSILSEITDQQKAKAGKLKAELVLVDKVPPLYVSVKVQGNGHEAVATISGEHDRFSHLEKDGKIITDLPLEPETMQENVQEKNNDKEFLKTLKLDDIIAFANEVDINNVLFIKEAIEINMNIAKQAIDGEYGLQVGKTTLASTELKKNAVPKSLSEAFDVAASYASAGSDARMSGCSMPVVINSGSGNQGLTVTVPLNIVAKYLKEPEDKLIRAVCVSQLVGLALTARKNRLSALCGAFTASIGTACGYVYLLGGDRATMDRAVNTMVGNLTGIICDGAKNTCALKIYSCLQAAALSVKLALKGFAPGAESGIVGNDSLESIVYLSRISSEGMEQTDKTIMSIMLDKHC